MEVGVAVYPPTHIPLPPNPRNSPTTLSLFSQCTHPNHIHQLHAHLIKTNKAHNNFYLSKLLSLLTYSNLISQARLLFDHAKKPNTLTSNTLIKAYIDNALFFEALLFSTKSFQQGLRPDSYTFPFVLNACASSPSLKFGSSTHSLALKLGFDANIYVQNALVDMYCKCLSIDDARKVFDEMVERDLVSWTSMVAGYARCGDMESAELVFGLMPERDVVSWGAMITGFVWNGCYEEALVVFREMQMRGVRPGEVAIVGALSSCASLGLRSLGLWLHGFVVRCGLELTVFMSTALVDMYGKCGDVGNAYRVFGLTRERNFACWNSMIGAFAMNGRTKEALSMFSEMEKAGIKPNSVTLSGVLCACRHGGLVEEGRYYFEYIPTVYDVSLNVDHYGCMVDLLGQAGCVNEAYELIKCMPFEPNEVVWGALLGACKIHGNLELGEHAFKQLVQLNPQNSGSYVLLSNMYAMRGQWHDVERVRAVMRDMSVEKPRGWSSIEVNSVVHEFYAGDRSHPSVSQVYEKLQELHSKMEVLGYNPSTGSQLYSVESY